MTSQDTLLERLEDAIQEYVRCHSTRSATATETADARRELDAAIAALTTPAQTEPDGWAVFMTSDEKVFQGTWYRARMDAEFRLDEAKRMGFIFARIAPVYIGTPPVAAGVQTEQEQNAVRTLILEEIEARDWTLGEFRRRMWATNACRTADEADLLCGLLLYGPFDGLLVGEDAARALASVFGTSEELWLNLLAANAAAPVPAPDAPTREVENA